MLKRAADTIPTCCQGPIGLRPKCIVTLTNGKVVIILPDITGDQLRSAAAKARGSGFLENADSLDKLAPTFDDETAKRMWFENA